MPADEAEGLIRAYRDALDKGEHVEQTVLTNYTRSHKLDWTPFLGTHWAHPTDTTLPANDLKRLAEKATTVPEGFKLHPTVDKVLAARRAMGAGEQPVDWGMAEILAYASLVENGYGVRISGEDSGPWHLQPSPRRAARPEPRTLGPGQLCAAASPVGKPG